MQVTAVRGSPNSSPSSLSDVTTNELLSYICELKANEILRDFASVSVEDEKQERINYEKLVKAGVKHTFSTELRSYRRAIADIIEPLFTRYIPPFAKGSTLEIGSGNFPIREFLINTP